MMRRKKKRIRDKAKKAGWNKEKEKNL